jgi:hypothetical protein
MYTPIRNVNDLGMCTHAYACAPPPGTRTREEGAAEGGKEGTRFYAGASIRHVWSAVGSAVGGALGLSKVGSMLAPSRYWSFHKS